jgi:hypothetical protein
MTLGKDRMMVALPCNYKALCWLYNYQRKAFACKIYSQKGCQIINWRHDMWHDDT